MILELFCVLVSGDPSFVEDLPSRLLRFSGSVEREGLAGRGGRGGIGMLLPLHCGHNAEYSPHERLQLTEVRRVCWIVTNVAIGDGLEEFLSQQIIFQFLISIYQLILTLSSTTHNNIHRCFHPLDGWTLVLYICIRMRAFVLQ